MTKSINGVRIKKSFFLNSRVRTTLTWLDIEVAEFLDRLQDKKYAESKKSVAKFLEIRGVIKALHMADVITNDEYLEILDSILGDIMIAEDKDYYSFEKKERVIS